MVSKMNKITLLPFLNGAHMDIFFWLCSCLLI
jgi:hypothetical protein